MLPTLVAATRGVIFTVRSTAPPGLRIAMQTASKVIAAMKTEGLAVPSVGRDTIVAPGAAARIAAAAQGTARAPAASLPPAPGAAVTDATAGKAAAPGPVAEILGIPV